MATNYYTGNAIATAQVDSFTPGGIAASAVYTVTENGKSISYTATATDTVATVCAAIVALLNAASTAPAELLEKTWATVGSPATSFTGTAKTAGKPFTVSVSVSVGATLTHSTSTASSGPNDISLAANWSASALPTNGDDVVLSGLATSLLYNLNSLSGVLLNTLTIYSNFTGTIGLPLLGGNGSYAEYRPTYWAIGTAALTVGVGDGNSSGRIKIDTGANSCAVVVSNTGAPLETGIEAMLWKGSNAGNSIAISKGSLGVAVLPGESANVSAGWSAGKMSNNATGDVTLRFGQNVTFSTGVHNQEGGTVTTQSAMATVNKIGGTINILGGAITNLNNLGGSAVSRGTGTITNLVIGGAGTFDNSQDMRAKTVANCSVYKGATIKDPNKLVAWTNGIKGIQCDPFNDCNLSLGTNIQITVTTL